MLTRTPRFILLAAFWSFAVVPQLCTVGAVVLPRLPSHRTSSASSKRETEMLGYISARNSTGDFVGNLTTAMVDGVTYAELSNKTDSSLINLIFKTDDNSTVSMHDNDKSTVSIHIKNFTNPQNNMADNCLTCTLASESYLLTIAACQDNSTAQEFQYDKNTGVISPKATSDVSSSTETNTTNNQGTSSNNNALDVILIFSAIQSQSAKFQAAEPPSAPNAPATVTATVTVGATPSPPVAGSGSLPNPTNTPASSKSNTMKVEVVGDDGSPMSASSTTLSSDLMSTSSTTSPSSSSAIDSNSPVATSTTTVASRNAKLRQLRIT